MDDLVDRCLEHLRALPFVRGAELQGPASQDPRGLDGHLSIETPEGRHLLPCDVRRTHLRRETAQLLAHDAERHPGLMVLAPSIGRELGELLERDAVNFVDIAGNCHVQLGDRYFARVSGRSTTDRARSDRGFRAPAYRVLFAFLVKSELIDAPSRAIAAEVGVSPQTANDVRRRLVEQGIVLSARGQHHWAPGRRKDALALWLAGFTASLAPSLLIGRFRARESDPVELERRIEPLLDATCEWRYGGGAAALRLTGHYRGDRTILYVENAPPDLGTRLQLVRDASGPIVIARALGKLAFESAEPRCVHPLLAYVDLLAEGHDRAREAAAELYDSFLPTAESTPRA